MEVLLQSSVLPIVYPVLCRGCCFFFLCDAEAILCVCILIFSCRSENQRETLAWLSLLLSPFWKALEVFASWSRVPAFLPLEVFASWSWVPAFPSSCCYICFLVWCCLLTSRTSVAIEGGYPVPKFCWELFGKFHIQSNTHGWQVFMERWCLN